MLSLSMPRRNDAWVDEAVILQPGVDVVAVSVDPAGLGADGVDALFEWTLKALWWRSEKR